MVRAGNILVLSVGGLALACRADRPVGAGRLDRIECGAWLLILAMAAAMAAGFLPVAGAAAASVGVEPIGFLWSIALAASVGFMLPVETPPNAIVTDSPAVTRAAILRAGALLDVAGISIAVGASLLLVPLLV